MIGGFTSRSSLHCQSFFTRTGKYPFDPKNNPCMARPHYTICVSYTSAAALLFAPPFHFLTSTNSFLLLDLYQVFSSFNFFLPPPLTMS